MSGRKQWNKQAATSSFLDKKTPQSLIQQGLEGSTVVGKDEVPGPNPGSSSNEKHSNLTVWVLFSALLQLLRTVRQFDETRLQHKTDTETDTTKKNEPDGITPEVIK